jgi:hypothetical protein
MDSFLRTMDRFKVVEAIILIIAVLMYRKFKNNYSKSICVSTGV